MNYINHLIYHSQAKPGLTKEDLSKILETSKRENLKNGVTGFLIYRDNYFLQLLEGIEDSVLETLDRIKKDNRHSSVTVVGEYKSINRLMADWSMALVDHEKMAGHGRSLIDLFELAREKTVFDSEKSFELVLKKFSKDAELFCEK